MRTEELVFGHISTSYPRLISCQKASNTNPPFFHAYMKECVRNSLLRGSFEEAKLFDLLAKLPLAAVCRYGLLEEKIAVYYMMAGTSIILVHTSISFVEDKTLGF